MRAAAVQLNSGEDTDRNLATADRLVRQAVTHGAELVVLPEKWSVLGRPEAMRVGAQPLDGECITWARETLTEMTLSMANESKAPPPERWQNRITGPEPPIASFHPAPFAKFLLEGSKEPIWLDSPIAREMAPSR